jgi:hypothetical protein
MSKNIIVVPAIDIVNVWVMMIRGCRHACGLTRLAGGLLSVQELPRVGHEGVKGGNFSRIGVISVIRFFYKQNNCKIGFISLNLLRDILVMLQNLTTNSTNQVLTGNYYLNINYKTNVE